MNTQLPSKGALRSKTILGAILTLIGSGGLGIVGGLSFDPATGDVTINLYNLLDITLAALVPAGGILAWVGRIGATRLVRGLF